jgi:hypothetical protein
MLQGVSNKGYTLVSGISQLLLLYQTLKLLLVNAVHEGYIARQIG